MKDIAIVLWILTFLAKLGSAHWPEVFGVDVFAFCVCAIAATLAYIADMANER